ncbi:MAG: tRNA-guanine transglycosylase [Lachnospiraceae bacterium]
MELSNTYHLHVRPGDEVVKKMGGLHRFMVLGQTDPDQIPADSRSFPWQDSGKIKEEGVSSTPISTDRKIFMGPEESMQIQSNLGLHDRDGVR